MASFAESVIVLLLIVGPYFVMLNININTKKIRGEQLTRWEKKYEHFKRKL